jgi:hypothetical protein
LLGSSLFQPALTGEGDSQVIVGLDRRLSHLALNLVGDALRDLPDPRTRAAHCSEERVDGPDRPAQAVALEIFGGLLVETVLHGVGPQVGIEPPELTRGPASDGRADHS